MKLLENGAFFSSTVCKHLSVFEVAQAVVITSKFKEEQVLPKQKVVEVEIPDVCLQRRCVPPRRRVPSKKCISCECVVYCADQCLCCVKDSLKQSCFSGHLQVVCKKVVCDCSGQECSMKMMVILQF